MDLIDLFIGSEGTLGVITEATLRVVASRPAVCLAFVPFNDRPTALGVVTRLRDAAAEAWRTGDPHGLDVSAIEHMDRAFSRLAQRGRRRPPVRGSNSSGCRDCALDYAGAAAGHHRCRRLRRDRPRARTGGARHAVDALLPGYGPGWRARCGRDRRARRSRPRGATRRTARGSACGRQCARGAREARRRPAHRQDRRGHDRAVRVARRP